MESILARALEYTLKYWLKSFSRDQFKLQGRTAQLSNLDINGDALHASIGLPPAITVTTAKVGKLEIILPALSYVQVEPIVVKIDRLDLVLEENDDVDESKTPSSQNSNTAKSSGYGFADKIADGMTLEVRTVNLLLETHGGRRHKGGASWASPMASITIRNLLLYTTNENWQVVNLKEARDFSNDMKLNLYAMGGLLIKMKMDQNKYFSTGSGSLTEYLEKLILLYREQNWIFYWGLKLNYIFQKLFACYK